MGAADGYPFTGVSVLVVAGVALGTVGTLGRRLHEAVTLRRLAPSPR
ncbi:hypothetical protein ACFVHB_38085 [Kitasatospora sp. NPDC127111]